MRGFRALVATCAILISFQPVFAADQKLPPASDLPAVSCQETLAPQADSIQPEKEPSRLRRVATKIGVLGVTLGSATALSLVVPDKYAVTVGIVTGVALNSLANSILGPLGAKLTKQSWRLETKAESASPKLLSELGVRYRALNAVFDLNQQNAVDHMHEIIKEMRRVFSEIFILARSNNPAHQELAYSSLAEFAIVFHEFKVDIPAKNRHLLRVARSRLRKSGLDPELALQATLALDPNISQDPQELDWYRGTYQAWLAR